MTLNVATVALEDIRLEVRESADAKKITLPLRNFRLTLQANGIPTLTALAAVPKVELRIRRSYRVQLIVGSVRTYYSADAHRTTRDVQNLVLFTGKVVSYGPGSSAVGSVSVQLVAQGMLAALNTGNMRYARFMPRRFRSLEFDTSYGAQAEGEGSSGNPAQFIDEDDFTDSPIGSIVNVFRYVIDPTLSGDPGALSPDDTRLLSSEHRALLEDFGELNVAALEVLNELRDLSDGARLRTEIVESVKLDDSGTEWTPMVGRVYQHVRENLLLDWSQDSFLTKIMALNTALGCAVVETGTGFGITPWSPFAPKAVHERCLILGADYNSISPLVGPASPVAGTYVLDATGMSTDFGAPTLNTGATFGRFARPRGTIGRINFTEAPRWLALGLPGAGASGGSADPDSAVRDADSQSTFGNLAWKVQEGSPVASVASRLAKFATWEANWANSAVEVTCPFFRTDIAPLTHVKLQVPDAFIVNYAPGSNLTRSFVRTSDSNDASTFGGEVYGYVDAISIEMDCNSGVCATSYRILAVHTEGEQEEIERYGDFAEDAEGAGVGVTTGEHPMFEGNWGGVRLDDDLSQYGRVAGIGASTSLGRSTVVRNGRSTGNGFDLG